METRRLTITGRVQGVGFRYSMTVRARQLGVNGWVRNRRDGSVEAMVAGSPAQIEEILAWSRRGPSGAAVYNVTCDVGYGEYVDFVYLPTA